MHININFNKGMGKISLGLSIKIGLRYLESKLYKVINSFIVKDNKTVFFVPHETCQKDGYDIINWTGDNTLCLVHNMIESDEYNDYHLNVVADNINKFNEYISYCHTLNPYINISFINRKSSRGIRKCLFRSKFIFVSSSVFAFNNKTRKQILVDLNYFTPFKNDYPYDARFRRIIYRTRKCFNYVITTAHLPSRIQALDLGLPLSSFLELGFPRNDIFYRYNNSPVLRFIKEKIFSKTNKIIVFTPTYRDYEKDENIRRDLFGYQSFDYKMLGDLLEQFHAVVIVKMHTMQIANIDVQNIKTKCRRIVFFEELEQRFSLYQCLAEADCLITDYTSVYFDFLHRDKPVIFNYYDLKEYSQYRGLSFNPIENISAGTIVKNADDLLKAVSLVLNGEDCYCCERRVLRNLFDCHYDGNSTQRICNYFFNKGL